MVFLFSLLSLPATVAGLSSTSASGKMNATAANGRWISEYHPTKFLHGSSSHKFDISTRADVIDVELDFKQKSGPVWQQLREAAGGSMYVGDVVFGNSVIPSVMDTGSISIISLTCKCPNCRGYTSTAYSQCNTDMHTSCTSLDACGDLSTSYSQKSYQMKISYVSGTTIAREASESIAIRGVREDGSLAELRGLDMSFYEITQNHLDIIKRDFFGAIVGVAPGCGAEQCFLKKSRRCPHDSCQSSFLHKAAGGSRYSFCLERFGANKPGWFVWNDVNRDDHPGAVKLKPLQTGSSGGDDAMLWLKKKS